MPYKTRCGSHYHETYGCHGATIACDTSGLSPCSDCCGSSSGKADVTAKAMTGAAPAPAPDETDAIAPSDADAAGSPTWKGDAEDREARETDTSVVAADEPSAPAIVAPSPEQERLGRIADEMPDVAPEAPEAPASEIGPDEVRDMLGVPEGQGRYDDGKVCSEDDLRDALDELLEDQYEGATRSIVESLIAHGEPIMVTVYPDESSDACARHYSLDLYDLEPEDWEDFVATVTRMTYDHYVDECGAILKAGDIYCVDICD